MKKLAVLGSVLVLVSLLVSSCGVFNGGTAERAGAITLEGTPLTLLGGELKVGQKAPDFILPTPYELLTPQPKQVSFSENQGKVRLISVVPSLDTPVCDLQTQLFEEEAAKLESVVSFYTISMDLPFAQARYCGVQRIKQMQVLSDYREGSFGLAYGVLIKELRLLSRAIFIVDGDDIIRYVEYVKEISQPPDYDKALAALQALISSTQVSPSPTVSPPSTVSSYPVEGYRAPDFRLNDLQGNTVSLSDFAGKPLFINFWVTWCPHCQAERPLIQEGYQEWQQKGLNILTIDMIGVGENETQANLSEFMQSNGYTFPVLLDVQGEAKQSYAVFATPTSYFIGADGVIREVKIGEFKSRAELEASLNRLLP